MTLDRTKKIAIGLTILGLSSGFFIWRAQTAQSAGAILYYTKEFIIKPLVRKIANSMENKLVNAVNKKVANINGKVPAFVTNWRNHILDSQARGNDVFRSVLADTALCSFFDNNVKTAFGADKYVGVITGSKVKDSSGRVVYQNKTNVPGLAPFQVSARCTLPKSFDAELFRKDFKKGGGWAAWNKLVEPQNNFFGAFSLSLLEQQEQIAIDQRSSENEALAGGGFLAQKLGTGDSGLGPTGCITGSGLATLSEPRCTFLGKTVTPAQILGKTAANEIDKKLGRVGGASELTDILLNLFAKVVVGITDRLENYIGQKTYNKPPQGGTSFDESDVPTRDPNIDAREVCLKDCRKQADAKCTAEAKTLDCSAQGGSAGTGGSTSCTDEVDQAKFNACMSEEEAKCQSDCSVPAGINP